MVLLLCVVGLVAAGLVLHVYLLLRVPQYLEAKSEEERERAMLRLRSLTEADLKVAVFCLHSHSPVNL